MRRDRQKESKSEQILPYSGEELALSETAQTELARSVEGREKLQLDLGTTAVEAPTAKPPEKILPSHWIVSGLA